VPRAKRRGCRNTRMTAAIATQPFLQPVSRLAVARIPSHIAMMVTEHRMKVWLSTAIILIALIIFVAYWRFIRA
jgi:hypothetical protein